jgi:hypothetical protein
MRLKQDDLLQNSRNVLAYGTCRAEMKNKGRIDQKVMKPSAGLEAGKNTVRNLAKHFLAFNFDF